MYVGMYVGMCVMCMCVCERERERKREKERERVCVCVLFCTVIFEIIFNIWDVSRSAVYCCQINLPTVKLCCTVLYCIALYTLSGVSGSVQCSQYAATCAGTSGQSWSAAKHPPLCNQNGKPAKTSIKCRFSLELLSKQTKECRFFCFISIGLAHLGRKKLGMG